MYIAYMMIRENRKSSTAEMSEIWKIKVSEARFGLSFFYEI